MTEQPNAVPATRVIRDVAALLCLLAALVLVNVVAWVHGVSTGLLATALDLGIVGAVLGSSR